MAKKACPPQKLKRHKKKKKEEWEAAQPSLIKSPAHLFQKGEQVKREEKSEEGVGAQALGAQSLGKFSPLEMRKVGDSKGSKGMSLKLGDCRGESSQTLNGKPQKMKVHPSKRNRRGAGGREVSQKTRNK